ncbi:MAG: methyltransferase [Bacteroidetes bacterium]|nr:MAG: methyltransferase [Bacteroidota bacterium]
MGIMHKHGVFALNISTLSPMPNTYFKFKQFTIHQDQCAMKVCTDACILGAWFAEKIPSNSSVLDIGSGTGLLMLMLAQKNKSEIDGIELDLPSFKQLKENIHQSKWKEHLRVFPGDVRNHAFSFRYDFIIVNPPFFENDLLSDIEEKNLAKHSKSLTLQELISVIDQNLHASGSFGILLPFHREKEFEELASARHFYPQEKLLVKQTPAHPYFRSIIHFSRNKVPTIMGAELTIQEQEGKYTPDFVELLRDYYLYL